MARIRLLILCYVACSIPATIAWSQSSLLAFPGAQGAGAYAKGGRDGDVYIVSNLNNSGAGSLRQGVDTSPAAGRIIVFSVSGAIDLNSDIIIDSPNITIAGQTAPAGGITLAHRALQIKDTHDVIVQHIATRPGDFATVPNVYEPDSLWIQNSDYVIVDHVSASWSTDEVLSTSHTSDQVTVQWSLISEALHNSNHGNGTGCCENHGYGGIIDGQQITYHHNLFAHNRSRNPRPGGQNTDADFVNNVIYNSGNEYGYSGSSDNLDLNYIGNFGIDGPNTTADQLYKGDSSTTRIYANGNFFDHENSANDPDGLLDLTAAGTSTLSGTYVVNAAPVNVGGVTVNATTAPAAYLQVLSYAGANPDDRDPIDRRIRRTVFNQTGDHIDSQDEVNGWHYPTPVTTALDPDGLPDSWKIENGLDPNDNNIGRQKPVPGGYTYLELYLHELNARYLPPSTTNQKTIRTAYGNGGDAQVNENGGSSAVSSGNGLGPTLGVAWGGTSGSVNQAIVLKFDLSEIVAGSIASASLELTAASMISGTHNFTVYGLEYDAAGWNWDEQTIEFNGAPGLSFDGDSRTLGVNDLFHDTGTGSAFTFGDPDDLLRLGALNLTGTVTSGSTVTFTNPNLAVFLNLAANQAGTPQDDIVTIVLQQNNNASAASLYSKEGNPLLAPRLVVDAVPILSGDYNDDGVVDAADYVVWRKNFGSNSALPNETVSDGIVDQVDFDAWKANFGASLGAGSGQIHDAAAPEPNTILLVMGGFTILLPIRPRRLPSAIDRKC